MAEMKSVIMASSRPSLPTPGPDYLLLLSLQVGVTTSSTAKQIHSFSACLNQIFDTNLSSSEQCFATHDLFPSVSNHSLLPLSFPRGSASPRNECFATPVLLIYASSDDCGSEKNVTHS